MLRDSDQSTDNRQPDSLSPCEQILYNLIVLRTGIVLRDFQIPVLRKTVSEACAHFGFSDAEALLHRLEQQNGASPEFEFMAKGITIGESYFFRHAGQLSLVRDELLPEMIARKRQHSEYSLRIWSAGCSGGQEIYSMVILLHEILPDIGRWKLYFLGTDINQDVLAEAVLGCYSEWSLRETPVAIRKKYFFYNAGKYQLRDNIRQQVDFSYLNLAEDIFPALHTGTYAMDIVLCRNVFIYLEREMIRQIMRRFTSCLTGDGILLLGPSDFINESIAGLEYKQLSTTDFFRRTPDACLPVAGAALRLSDISKNEVARDSDYLPRIATFLQNGRWQDTLGLIDETLEIQGESALLLQVRSKVLASLGRLAEALQTCQGSLTLNPIDKHTYLLQGTIYLADTQPQKAEQAFRKAIFLDYAFSEAHYQLGLLLIHQGNRQAGLKCLAHALMHAGNEPQQRVVHNTPGMTYARFAEIIQHEMQIHAGDLPAEK